MQKNKEFGRFDADFNFQDGPHRVFGWPQDYKPTRERSVMHGVGELLTIIAFVLIFGVLPIAIVLLAAFTHTFDFLIVRPI